MAFNLMWPLVQKYSGGALYMIPPADFNIEITPALPDRPRVGAKCRSKKRGPAPAIFRGGDVWLFLTDNGRGSAS